jgi:hypothetical protein
VRPQQVASHDGRLADTQGQAVSLHPILDGQNALLEQLALCAMRRLGGVFWYSACLLGKRQIRITGPIGGLHGCIAGQRRRDPKLLLLPVDVRNAMAWRWLDQPAQPNARSENEF